MRPWMIAVPFALAACAANPPTANEQAALAAVPGKATGEPISCLQMRDIERIEPVNTYVAFVHTHGGKVFRTDFPGGCPGLKRGDALSIRTTIAKYCRGDIVQTFHQQSGVPSGSCTFGDFTPYELPEAQQ